MDNKQYTRKCPECNKELYYSSQDSLYHSKGHLCKECGIKHRVIIFSDEAKRTLSEKAKAYHSLHKHEFIEAMNKPDTKITMSVSHKGIAPPNKGIPQTAEQRQKNSDSHKGQNVGIKRSEETKRKHRIRVLNHLRSKGIGVFEDRHAKNWFEKYNTESNSNFQPKRFMEIGYDADGYDAEQHSWAEFDPPHHNRLGQKKKDLIRQTNIIEHFNSIGNPLKHFIRASADENGNVLSVTKVF